MDEALSHSLETIGKKMDLSLVNQKRIEEKLDKLIGMMVEVHGPGILQSKHVPR